MNIYPNKANFISNYNAGKPQLVWHEMIADLDTPITASLKLMKNGDPFFLLESIEGGETRGRYSIISMEPDRVWKCDDEKAEISSDSKEFIVSNDDILTSFRKFNEETKLEIPEELPPMAAGLVGYMGYDAIRLIEKTIPNDTPDSIGIPVGMFMRPTLSLIFDSVSSSIFIITPVRPNELKGISAEDAYNEATNKIKTIIEKLKSENISNYHSNSIEPLPIEFTSNFTKDEFEKMVRKAQEYILAGDIFQVVPSQRFKAKFDASPFAFYRSLRHMNPSPFLFFLNFEDFHMVGSSPEIMVRLRDDKVTIRPLAGTRKRGKNKKEDEQLAADLLSDEKEIAEHLMLIDLARNDVGKISKAGTVKVTERMIIEHYSHVMHISSNVEGEIAPEFDALDALLAGIPVGTVSGAPKVRAMQIIDELEPDKRSFYAGCVGYFSANGTMDTCIALRTALIKDGELILQAGAGVVADSDPESEYFETMNKAKALMKAAEEASKFE
ncbi:MAG: anthranilate synthase component I [Alphaproteobacteria bacterium]|nr:anthranilate synthase component I [Alphaproteobacteria bacterium]